MVSDNVIVFICYWIDKCYFCEFIYGDIIVCIYYGGLVGNFFYRFFFVVIVIVI